MQTFVNIEASNSLKASRSSINENFESVASDFSGTMFPDVSLVVGMKCYRTDLGKVFRLTGINPPIWTEISDLNDSYVKSSVFNEVLEDYTKSASPSFNVPVIAPKFVGELDGNSKTVSALKSPFKLSLGGSVSSDISLVNGSKDVIVNVKDIKAEALKGTATIDVKGNVTGDLTGTASKATSDANGNPITSTYLTSEIVASSMTTNGYVKYKSGLIIQWGKLTNRTGTFLVPFSTTVFFAVATSDTIVGTWARPVIPMKPVTTLTGVSFTGLCIDEQQANTWSTYSFNGRYFCIGV